MGNSSTEMDERIEVATLGEAMVVMDPLSRGPLRHVGTFAKRVGGAELNVAVGLSRLGHRAGWAGHLGDDEFGKEILTFLRGEGVDVSRVGVDPEAPTGLYFKERRALDQLRAYYYRTGSAASRMSFEDLDVDYLLSGEVLHLTGITSALAESCRDLTERLVREANERNVPVSFDANVRFGLLKGRKPQEVLGLLIDCADVLFLSDEEAELLMGGSSPQSVRQAKKGPKSQIVVVHGAEGAFALDGDELAEKKAYPTEAVDTVGAGDAFVAGFLSGWLQGWSAGECLELANACGACAVSVPGDAESMPTKEDALALVQGSSETER